MLNETSVHILGGGIGGTVGAIVTCPLEVVKVRLQSSQGLALRSGPLQTSIERAHHDPTSSRHTSPLVYRIFKSRSRRNKGSTRFAGTDVNGAFRSVQHSIPRDTSLTSQLSYAGRQHATRVKHTGLRRSVVLRCLLDITRNEGFRALFKGFLPTMFGVLPSRGVYFSAYHKGQVFFEDHLPVGSSAVYFCAAGFGSITASSLTNPIWFIKTRLQLDSRPGLPPITVGQVIRNTWRREGFRGFYRGVTASYVGSLETAVNFVIYENVKARLLWWDRHRQQCAKPRFAAVTGSAPQAPCTMTTQVNNNTAECRDLRGSLGGSKLNASSDMVLCMLASAFSKAVAITATYPHEVVRTRLRELDGRYHGFIGTIRTVVREEGALGLYRGMGTHYLRQVPNSCIMIGTYEFVVYLLDSWGLTKHAQAPSI